MPKKEEKETKYPFSNDFQRRIIAALLTDVPFFKRCITLIVPEFFDNPIHQGIFRVLTAFWEEYGNLPDGLVEVDQVIYEHVVEDKKELKEEVDREMKEIAAHIYSEDNFNYVSDKVVEFAHFQAAKIGTIESAKLLKEGKIKEAQQVVEEGYKVGLDEDAQKAESVAEFLKRNIPKRDVFVQSWAERKRLTILGGREKVGKSLIVIDMMIHLAKGEQFLELNVPEPRRVLYIQQELAKIDLQKRLKQMLVEKVPMNFFHKTTTGNVLKIDNPAHRQLIHNDIEKVKPDLVVFDPYQTFHTKRENSNEDMNKVLDFFYEIIHRYDCGVFLIHHFSKPGEALRTGAHQFRGASALGDRADILICMNKLDKKYEKQLPLDYNDFAELSFDLRSDAKPLNIIVVRDTERLQYGVTDVEEQIVRIKAENIATMVEEAGGEMEQKAVVAELMERGLGYNASLETIKNAVWKGYVVKHRMPGRGAPLMLKAEKLP